MESITPQIIKLSDFPKWVARGSTWINQNGFLIDMANLPPDICKTEREWWNNLRCSVMDRCQIVTQEDVDKAYLVWQQKEKSCEYCKRRRFLGFSRMKRQAADRKRRAAMPEKRKKLKKFTRKMYYIEVDWDQDWFSTMIRLISFLWRKHVSTQQPFSGLFLLHKPNGPFQGHTLLLHFLSQLHLI